MFQYLEIVELANGNLQISLTAEGKEFLTEKQEDNYFTCGWFDLMENYACNGSYSPTDSSEIGGLTEAPIILSCKDVDDNGAVIIHPDTKIWYYNEYMINDPFAVLLSGDPVIFTLYFEPVKATRADMKILNILGPKGWIPEFSSSDKRYKRTDLYNDKSKFPHDNISYRKGNKALWIARPFYESDGKILQYAELVDNAWSLAIQLNIDDIQSNKVPQLK